MGGVPFETEGITDALFFLRKANLVALFMEVLTSGGSVLIRRLVFVYSPGSKPLRVHTRLT